MAKFKIIKKCFSCFFKTKEDVKLDVLDKTLNSVVETLIQNDNQYHNAINGSRIKVTIPQKRTSCRLKQKIKNNDCEIYLKNNNVELL